MAMSTVFLLLVLSFLPTSESSTDDLPEPVQKKLPEFVVQIEDRTKEMANAATVAFAIEMASEINAKLSEAAVNVGYKTQKTLTPSKFSKVEMKDDGSIVVQMDPNKTSATVSQIMTNAYWLGLKVALRKAKLSAYKAAKDAANQHNWEYKLEPNGEIVRGPGKEIRMQSSLSQAKKQKKKAGKPKKQVSCNKQLCKKDSLAECINSTDFMNNFICFMEYSCFCPASDPIQSRALTMMMASSCLANFTNSDAVSSLTCRESVTEAVKSVGEIILGFFCDCGFSGYCIMDAVEGGAIVQAISSSANLCVSTIDPNCLMSAMENFVSCILGFFDAMMSVCMM